MSYINRKFFVFFRNTRDTVNIMNMVNAWHKNEKND